MKLQNLKHLSIDLVTNKSRISYKEGSSCLADIYLDNNIEYYGLEEMEIYPLDEKCKALEPLDEGSICILYPDWYVPTYTKYLYEIE